jgi:hypothetical protein
MLHLPEHLAECSCAAARGRTAHDSIAHAPNGARDDFAVSMTRNQDGKLLAAMHCTSGWNVLVPHGIDPALPLLAARFKMLDADASHTPCDMQTTNKPRTKRSSQPG